MNTTPEASSTIRVAVYHKTEDLFWDYQAGQPLTLVAVLTEPAGDPEEICDRMYDLFNVRHDPEFGETDPRACEYRARRNRSLSMGDVIAISSPGTDEPEFWACARGAGWTRLEDITAYVTNAAAHGTTPLDADQTA